MSRTMFHKDFHRGAPAAALFVLLATLCGAAQAQQPFSADAMWKLKRLADPAISPDGRLAVVPVTSYDMDKNEPRTDLWLVPTKPGKARQLTSDTASDSSPAWSPDARTRRSCHFLSPALCLQRRLARRRAG